jgi:mono/diheme cytochrome c family protein
VRPEKGQPVRRFWRTSLLVVVTIGVPGLAAWANPPAAQSPAPASETMALYKSKCQACHLATGDNKMANMSFTDGVWRHGSSVKEVSDVIRNGVKGTLMQGYKAKLTDAQIEALARYVRAFDKTLKD